jgi:hypothetical protein
MKMVLINFREFLVIGKEIIEKNLGNLKRE